MLEVKGLPRRFEVEVRGEKVLLDDLNPKATAEEVKRLYCDQYPELASATITGPIMTQDHILYKLSPKVGTKG